MIPMDEAREAIGPEFAENSIVWTSKDNIIMTITYHLARS
jgi:hypothetical protein